MSGDGGGTLPGTADGAALGAGGGAEARPAARAALWEDFVDVLHAPARVYARRAGAGAALPLLVVSVLAALAFFATRPFLEPYVDRAFDAQLAQMQRPGMSAEQAAQARAMARRFADGSLLVGGTIGTPIFVLLVSLLTWASARLVGARVDYGRALLVTTYAWVPRLLGALVTAGVLAVRDPATLPLGLQAFASPALFLGADASPIVVAIASRFDLFTLWTTALLGIGIAVVGRVPRAKGWTAAAIAWGVGTLLALLGALRQMAATPG